MSMSLEDAVADVYRRLISGWNANDATDIAAAISPDGLVIGYDGSQMFGRDQVRDQLAGIFRDHQTASYVPKIRSIRTLGAEVGLLHAVVGMVPPGGSEIVGERNAIQTVVARRDDHGWSAALFQTTPAQFHGRPELAEALTAELAEVLATSREVRRRAGAFPFPGAEQEPRHRP
jgi:uncharacterized protein (TIGR02246 family)